MLTFLKHYKINLAIALVMAVAIIIIRGDYALITIILTLVAAKLTVFFFDLEFIFYAYFAEPNTTFSTSLRTLFSQKNYVGAISFIEAHGSDAKNPILRSALFQILLIVIAAYLVFSKVGPFGVTFAVTLLAQSIYLGWERRHLDWFWNVKMTLTNNVYYFYFGVISVISVFLLLSI
ncbi:MAG: hypothetical protein NT141_01770 [candidate division WWE3 bacterium]|nr:hypothetical protein [candidate division WWE3 bacterium]